MFTTVFVEEMGGEKFGQCNVDGDGNGDRSNGNDEGWVKYW